MTPLVRAHEPLPATGGLLLRASATMLESYRLWRDQDPEQLWMSDTALAHTILNFFDGSPDTRRGTAWGLVLADPARYAVTSPLGLGVQGYQVEDRRCGSWYFPVDLIQPAIDRFDRGGVFEAKREERYGNLVVVSKADQLWGCDLVEVKTTARTPDPDRYHASYQWRFMLDGFGAKRCTYVVYQLDEDRSGYLTLADTAEFREYPYPALHAECAALAAEFVDFVTAAGYAGHLARRQEAFAA